MARKTEKRDVEVKYCDFCGKETEYLERCAVCKREMCNEDGGKAHGAYSVEVYRYSDGQRIVSSKVCKNCAGKKFDGTIQEFFDGMMGKAPILTTEA